MKDLTGYKLVFFDDFDKGALDEGVWRSRNEGKHGAHGVTCSSIEQASVSDSILRLRAEYKTGKYGTGWYGCYLGLRERYTKGYYECRCKPNHALPGGVYSAFWIQAEHPYEPEISRGGLGGAELDIFECYTGDDGVEFFESTIHCAGKQQRIRPSKPLDSLIFLRCVPDNLCSEFHTFGLDWDDDAYTIYLDGVKLSSTSWGDGTSNASGEVILSACGGPKDPDRLGDTGYASDFEIDWVKIWQK